MTSFWLGSRSGGSGALGPFPDALGEPPRLRTTARRSCSAGRFRVSRRCSRSYCVERIVPGIFKKLHGREIYDYAKIDRFMRLIGSRMNNNIWLLLIATTLGWPKEGFYFISLWMLVTASWHTLRLLSRYNSFIDLYLKLKK